MRTAVHERDADAAAREVLDGLEPDEAAAGDHRAPGARHLACARRAAQLMYGFRDVQHASNVGL